MIEIHIVTSNNDKAVGKADASYILKDTSLAEIIGTMHVLNMAHDRLLKVMMDKAGIAFDDTSTFGGD